jgi:hypothetical protein
MSSKFEITQELAERLAAADMSAFQELRLLLAAPAAEPTLAEHCKQCAEVVRTWPESKRDCLGKIEPIVERQELNQ